MQAINHSTAFDHATDEGTRRSAVTLSRRDDGTSTVVFGPLLKWVGGIAGALLVSGVAALMVMATQIAAFQRDFAYIRDDITILKQNLSTMTADRYTGAQASQERASMLDLVKTNSSDIGLIHQTIGNIRDRLATVEAESRTHRENGR